MPWEVGTRVMVSFTHSFIHAFVPQILIGYCQILVDEKSLLLRVATMACGYDGSHINVPDEPVVCLAFTPGYVSNAFQFRNQQIKVLSRWGHLPR